MKRKGEGRSLSRLAGYLNLYVMAPRDFPHDRQPQPCAFLISRPRMMKPVENVLDLLWRNARAFIPNQDDGAEIGRAHV